MTDTKRVTWPYAVKTVAISNVPAQPAYVQTQDSLSITVATEMAFEVFTPLYVYAPTGLFMHLKYTFSGAVSTQYQQISRVYVRDTPSSYVQASGSTVEKYMTVNWVADGTGTIEQSIDLTSLLTGKSTNVVFLRFPWQNYPYFGRGNDTVVLWKLDLVYQTIGIRNEK